MASKKKPATGKSANKAAAEANGSTEATESSTGEGMDEGGDGETDASEAAFDVSSEAEFDPLADEPADAEDPPPDDLEQLDTAPARPAPPASSPRAAPQRTTASIPRVPAGPPVRTTQAFVHGKAAAGARQIKPGFGTTPEADLAFALGFPHLEYIVDDHPDDARAEMIAYERRRYRLGWPRNIAIRWCRITASKGCHRTPQGATELDTAGKKALKNGAALTPDEIALTLKSIFSDTSSYEDLRDLVRLFEAFAGPELIATSIVDALEKATNNLWNHQDHDRALAVHHLGFLLLRIPTSPSEKLRNRLAAIFDRRVKALPTKELPPRKGERGSLLRALDVVLHGRLGAERSGERDEDGIDPGDLVHVTADEAFVRELATQRASPDPRLVFLGGEPVLEHLVDRFVRLRGHHHLVLDGFAEVASPRAIELLQRIARGKEAPERAQAVLAARGVR
jgi:hypothetical protein